MNTTKHEPTAYIPIKADTSISAGHVISAILKDSRTMIRSVLIAILLLLPAAVVLNAGQDQPLRCRVTYVTSAQIYCDAGKDDGLSVGDTLTLTRGDTSVGAAVIIGLSSHSCVCRPLVPAETVARGDIATWSKGALHGAPLWTRADSTRGTSSPSSATRPSMDWLTEENVLAGRVGFQYAGQLADDSRLNSNQPSIYARMRLQNIGGTGMTLSFSGREYYDFGDPYLRYGDSTRSRFDLSELSIESDRSDAMFGFHAGRFISRYVVGTGALDGAEVFMRHGFLTGGVFAGAGVQSRVMGIGGNQRSMGGFLALHFGESSLDSYDASAAYVRQTVGGNIDRVFLSVQNAFTLGGNLTAFGNADVELNEMNNGVRSSHPSVSSLLLFVHYKPAAWISTDFGYDGMRSVYLFESMKSVPDSLFHEALRHGFRLSATMRFGKDFVLTTEAGLRSSSSDGRRSHTLGAGFRVLDILFSRVYGGVRYRNVGGSFLNGSQLTVEAGRNMFQKLDLLLQYDWRTSTYDQLKQTYVMHTFGGNVNYWISRNWYGTLGADYALDTTMNGLRYFLECGYRF